LSSKQPLWSKNFFMVAAINFFLYFIYYLLIASITVYSEEKFHASSSMGGLVAGIFIVGVLLGRLYAGKSINQVGWKKMLLIGILFSTVTILLYFAVNHLSALLIVRCLHGIGFGIASTATGTIVASVIPDERRGEGTGYYALSTTVAAASGPFFGILIHQHAGFQTNYVICLALIVISFVSSLFLEVPAVPWNQAQPYPKKGFRPGDYFEPAAVPVAIVSIFIGVAYSSILSFIGSYAQQIYLVDVASFFFVVYSVATLLARPFAGKLFDAKGENVVVYPALLIFAAGLLTLSQVHTGWMLLMSAAIIGLGYGTYVPCAQAIAVKVSPRHRMGLATSTFFMFTDLGVGFGPFFLGILIPLLGFSNLYVAMALLVLADAILYYFLHGRKRNMPFQSNVQ